MIRCVGKAGDDFIAGLQVADIWNVRHGITTFSRAKCSSWAMASLIFRRAMNSRLMASVKLKRRSRI
jgi:hypothetical protein